jgi:anti-sigma regulatory factor (Ser/Thr protein kinase)
MQGVNQLESIPNSRSRVHTIVAEILANAVDHGVLGLDSSMKNTADGFMQYYQEKLRRLESHPEGNIRVMLNHDVKEEGGGRLTINVVDSGEGFDFQHINNAIQTNSGFSGRGISLITQLCKEVRFLDKGNTITAIYEWD